MLDIEYKGGNAVVLSTKKTVAVVDPKLSEIGLKDLSTKSSIELATEARFAINDSSAQLNIEGPGEYEVGQFSIRGVSAQHYLDAEEAEFRSTMYRLEVDDVRVAVIGNVSASISESQYEDLGLVDVLIIPVGGGTTLDAVSAAAITRQIDPKAVIPVHYADEAIKYEVPQDDVEVFKKELGAPVETAVKYKIKAVSSLPSVLTVIELARS